MVGAIHRPGSEAEVAQALRAAKKLRIWGLAVGDSASGDLADTEDLVLTQLKGINEYSPSDQVMTVRAGTTLNSLADFLRSDGFVIPSSSAHTIGGAISIGDAFSGIVEDRLKWRDCVLGMRVVLADGRAVKFGSQAVKNVAGYDGHKLFIGARGTLGIIAEVFLRLTPGEPPLASTIARETLEPITDPTVIRFMSRAKDLFDPTHKLNPGEMGIF